MAAVYQHTADGKPADKVGDLLSDIDGKLGADLDPKERVERLERIGCGAVIGRDETLARAIATYRASLFVPSPRKQYVVHFSNEPITGSAGWDALAVKPEAQKMDRAYGGSMDFLETDVATGNRGEGVSAQSGAAVKEKPSISIVADAAGLHFRFVTPDARARDIENRVVGGGSYETYLAPGANQPYLCLMPELQSGRLGLFNTTYSTAGHRRIREKDTSLYRTQTLYTDDTVVTYFMLSWDAYASRIPGDGDIWDFECFNWGRDGNAAWNGAQSIHGRSDWGELVFDMPDAARAAILRRVLFPAVASYKSARDDRCYGALAFWKDDALGDPAFYAECLAPLVAKLDAFVPLVKSDMTDAEVFRLAEEALPAWHDIRFTVARLRAQFLAKP